MRRGLLVLIFLVAALGTTGVVAGLSGRSDLEEARRQIDQRWAALEAPLDTRYQALAEVSEALDEGLGESLRPETDEASLASDTRSALARWESLGGAEGRVEERVLAASALEGLHLRITVTVKVSARLRASKRLAAALTATGASSPEQIREHNDAVRRYEDLRGSLPRRLLAAAFGFDPRPTLELPS